MNARQTIRKKIALAIAASLGVGLLLSFLTFAVREIDQRRQAKTTELFAMADVVAFNASAVIEFRDVLGAKRLLSSFAEHQDVLAVRLIGISSDFHYRYDAAGRPLPAQVALGDKAHRERAVYADWSSVTVAVPIRSDDEVVGTVSISASLDAVWRAIIWNLTLSLLALAISFLIAFAIARQMLASILAALGSLTDTAQYVAESKDYTRQAKIYSDDEIGHLGNAFNTMLSEIAERDGQLADQRDHLEDTVHERTQALSLAKEAAEAASRAKSTFLSNMSHELRTPMNAIIGMTYMLRRNNQDPGQMDKLGKIDNAANHLLQLLNDILDLSKIDADRMTLEQTAFMVDTLTHELANLLAPRAEAARLHFILDIDARLKSVQLLGDPLRLQQILLNLAGNAIKFTERGEVRVVARIAEDGAESVLLELSVWDTGIGIAPEALERIFRPFEQADGSTTRKYGGTGLGLPICQRLVHLMGGEIEVVSTPGSGSVFTFAIRLSRALAMPAESESAETHQSGIAAEHALRSEFPDCRVLVAEDDWVNQEVALELLRESLGFTVDIAADGAQALDMAISQRYDLILMDMQMPELDGLGATQAIREIDGYADTPIIAMTANAFAEDRALCLDAGMNDFIAKPVDPDKLFVIMLKWLRARQPESIS
ncbi:ATP-binding protein [Dechloromonas sp.]|uniref:hybrid sensor histidine kinase/response regulator n=1 Tax=Dechloromonas sp. TaxID=1917218 RepID=UPI00286E70D0|nr:ATP-binding protein [Dechloromonas sp.]